MARTIVVIGGAGGGPIAAARAREEDEHARIVLVEKKPRVSWVQAGLRHHLEGKVRRIADLDQERAAFFHERHRVEVRTGTSAVRIDPESRRIVLRTVATGAEDALRYDAVIFSGGAEIVRPDVPGLEGPRVVGFRSADDLAAIRLAIEAGARRATVIGCGPYGVDAADGLRAAGLEVDVVERGDRILSSLSLLGARAAARQLSELGVRLHLRDEIVAATPRTRGKARAKPLAEAGLTLALRSGKELDADLVILATGLRPSTALLSEAGASLNADGSVRTNAEMLTTLPGVYACGTAVSVVHSVTRTPLWTPQAAIAARTAQIAGRNAGAGAAKELLPPLAGSALYVVGDQRFARTGLSETEARAALGDERVVVTTSYGYAGEPWIGGDAMCVRLVVDRKKNAVVGGEVWGREGVPRRIDLLSVAVEGGWSPGRIADLDLAYAPTLGPALDPLHAAGVFASLTLAGEARPVSAEALALRVLRQGGDDGLAIVDVSRPGQGAKWPEGTLSIPLEALRERLGEVPRDRPAVLVSQTGQRAYQAWRILTQRGFTEAQHLDGGWYSFGLTLD
jgi:NADPH-dependent 2,4-dienoyl-CoA reductase/sulfur reductase-like enzyme/rhodanese-related sulfurtransferase